MIQWIGVWLVGISATWLGIGAAREEYWQARKLDELEQALAALQRELELAAVSLPQMLLRLEKQCGGSGGELFARVRAGMEQLEEKTMDQIWREALDQLEPIDPDGRQCMQPLGGILGGYGAQEQIQGVEIARRRLDVVRAERYERAKKQGKIYSVLGVTGGCFLILVCL